MITCTALTTLTGRTVTLQDVKPLIGGQLHAKLAEEVSEGATHFDLLLSIAEARIYQITGQLLAVLELDVNTQPIVLSAAAKIIEREAQSLISQQSGEYSERVLANYRDALKVLNDLELELPEDGNGGWSKTGSMGVYGW